MFLLGLETGWKNNWGYDIYCGSFYTYNEHVTFQGCRGLKGRITRFNKKVGECWTEVVTKGKERVTEGIKGLNDSLEKFIERKNEETKLKAINQYCNVRNYQAEWLEKNDDAELLKELADVEAQYRALFDKQAKLAEAVRLSRVKAVKNELANPNSQYPVDKRLKPGILAALENINAMNSKGFHFYKLT
jgi:hypothetical protein